MTIQRATCYHEQSRHAKLNHRKSHSSQTGFYTPLFSFTTPLLESGTGLAYIQELTGHENSKTTEILTQVSNPELSKIACFSNTLNI